MNLYAHQQRFLDRNKERSLLCWQTGSGKTIGALAWAQKYITILDERVLIICPKALKANWYRNCAEHIKAGFLILTKEEFRSKAATLPEFSIVIVDEAHMFAGMKSQMSKSLSKYFKKYNTRYRLLLTATPYTSSPWSIYMLARLLGYDWSYAGFKDKFFVDRYFGQRLTSVPRHGITNDVAQMVAMIGDVVSMDECVDVPPQIHEVEYFALTPEQIKIKKGITEIMPIVKFTKYSCIENGVLMGDEYNENKIFDTNKTERLKMICNDSKKVAVVCRYNLQIDALYQELTADGHKVFIIRGDVKDRDAVVQEVEKTDECVVLIQADCAEGYQLPSISVIVFMSMSYSLVKYTQMLGRFLRIDKLEQGRNVFTYLLTEEDSIDKAVYDSIMSKQDFSIAIYASKDMV